MQTITRSRYAADMKFEDPLVKYASLDGFALNVRLLKSAFKINFTLHDIGLNGPEEIRTRYAISTQAARIYCRRLHYTASVHHLLAHH